MKKNISININGIVFYIEEDGYEVLSKYLDSIHAYFSSFDNNNEIVSDIEGRVAEIFIAKRKDDKQAITLEDVHSLIKKLGSVNDFKATQEFNSDQGDRQAHEEASDSGAKTSGNKKLYRDTKEKIIGGVCAGMGHYFNIDSVWPRLLFVVLTIVSFGAPIIIYIIFWIAMPSSDNLEASSNIKKMFRDPNHKVLGGVTSGMAAFFRIDVVLVRVLFILSIFMGGAGLLMYLVLWGVLPEAKSMTEKMQMQGKAVTLSNIEATVKKKIQGDKAEEKPLTKIILFPFRLIALILDKAVKIVTVLIMLCLRIIVMVAGVLVIFVGVIFLVCMFSIMGIGFGLTSFSLPWLWGAYEDVGLPIEAMSNAFPVWALIPLFTILFVLLLCVLLAGISILRKKNTFKPAVGWSLFIVFLISIGALGIAIPRTLTAFKKSGTYRQESTYTLNGSIPIMQIYETGMDGYDVTSLDIIGHDDSVIHIVKIFKAQGKTRRDARKNAKMVTYNIKHTDSTFVFNDNITFKPDAVFRVQQLHVKIYLPFGQTFEVSPDLWDIVDNYEPYNSDDCLKNRWNITRSGIVCAEHDPQLLSSGTIL